MSAMDGIRQAMRYAVGLYQFWRAPRNWDHAEGNIRARLAERGAAFVRFVQQTVYANSASPYLPLFRAAAIDETRLASIVEDHGVEGALLRLYEAGVHVTLDEFKGRVSMRRSTRDLSTGAACFDNPSNAGHLVSSSGETRSSGTRLSIDLMDTIPELPARYLYLKTHRLFGRPYVVWRPAPPAIAGLRNMLRTAKVGLRPVRWFSQTRPGVTGTGGKSAFLAWCTTLGSLAMGHRIPLPEYVPVSRAETIARWLATKTQKHVGVYLETTASSAVRLCLVARDLGLDIRGHTVETNSEPLTEAKRAILQAAGFYVCTGYGMTESGIIGLSCGEPTHPDDLHVLSFRVALVQQRLAPPGWTLPVDALLLTVFSSNAPKVMLNVEVGDHAVMSYRECHCPLGQAGLAQHIHTVRSYEKLTSAGMHFQGADLLDLLETALPARFGGGPTDYQFVESEQGGETVLRLIVHPRLGMLDADALQAFVLRELRRRSAGGRLMTEIWRDSRLLRVERSEPYVTAAAKIQPLHIERPVTGGGDDR